MGMVFGKISVEIPKYEVLKSTSEYEIRRYPPCIVAEITYDPSQMKGQDKDGGFTYLANYIGVLGNPQNAKVEKIAMTAPVITTSIDPRSTDRVAMTPPVVTKNNGDKKVTMQFILPDKFKSVADAPKPLDEKVVIKEEGERKYGVVKFSGVANDDVVNGKVEMLKLALEKDGFKVFGDYLLARYNPPWTLPMFRTNELMIPLE